MAVSDDPTLVHPALPGQDAATPCATCGAPLADDQRYCLECGTRRADARVPFDVLVPAGAAPGVAPGALVERPSALTRLGGLWGVVALLLVALTAGVVIGRSGDDEPVAAAPAPAPVVNISGGAGGAAAATTTAGEVTDQWPTGRAGFTVELQRLPKASTDQAAADAARAAAVTAGATDVGVLDGDAHGLTADQWIVYSGVYATRREAREALPDARSAFADAAVVRVEADGADAAAASTSDDGSSSGSSSDDGGSSSATAVDKTVSKADLQKQSELSPEEFQKQSKKLPDTVGVGGKPPAKDGGTPGGGTDAETIG